MISIDRGAEPPELRIARERRLATALTAYHKHGEPSSNLLVGYDSGPTKERLYLAQFKKCAWCERRRDLSSSPVEHYRPKNGAWRHRRGETKRVVDAARYWWLTWTWENLLFCCPRCNDQGHKGNYFPLRTGSSPLPLPRHASGRVPPKFFVTAGERPLLLDPTRDDPMKHIVWEPASTTGSRREWTWQPRGKSPEGWETISVLRLDELCDEAGEHLQVAVLPGVEDVERNLSSGRLPLARKLWRECLTRVLAPGASFSAVSYWALQIWVPDTTRRTYRLADIPRPGARRSAP